MPAVAGDIGPRYDILLATRDGSTLSCRNIQGQTVQISSLAYMSSTDRSQDVFHEETELQHKDRITQLGSPNLIDREFDQWPQVTQGDWSGGMLQRVFTGATPISGGVESDPTRYWDSIGLLTPRQDYLIKRPSDVTNAPASGSPFGALNGDFDCAPGTFEGLTAGYAFAYTSAANNIVAFRGGLNGTGTSITNPTQIAGLADLFMGHGAIWYMAPNGAGGTGLFYIKNSPATATKLADVSTTSNNTVRGSTTGTVGNQQYVAVCTRTFVGTASSSDLIQIYNVTTTAATFTSNSVTPVQLPLNWRMTDMAFLGTELLIAITDGYHAQILDFTITSGTFTTAAELPGSGVTSFSQCYLCSLAGVAFVVANGQMYLLQGSSLQHIAQVPSVVPAGQAPFLGGTYTRLTTLNGYYAVFIVFAGVNVAVFAYDVLAGRLFRMEQITLGTIPGAGQVAAVGSRIAGLGSFQSSGLGPVVSYTSGVAFTTLPGSGTATVTNEEMGFDGISSLGGATVLGNYTIVSSLIDFTSASNKLFRQVSAEWAKPGFASDTAQTIQIDVWLDQDPDALSGTPDFTTGPIAGGLNGGVVGQVRLDLNINQIAKKLVYRIITGTGTNPSGAVKLKEVIIRAATGWVQTLQLNLAPNVVLNNKSQGMTWLSDQQLAGQPQVDSLAAYNFIRQLWRLKGGECTATYANGDSGNWLLQDIHFDSPKPFALQFLSDQRQDYQVKCMIKLREDL